MLQSTCTLATHVNLSSLDCHWKVYGNLHNPSAHPIVCHQDKFPIIVMNLVESDLERIVKSGVIIHVNSMADLVNTLAYL